MSDTTSRPRLIMLHMAGCWHCQSWKPHFVEFQRNRLTDFDAILMDVNSPEAASFEKSVVETPTFRLEFPDLPGCTPMVTPTAFKGDPSAQALGDWVDRACAMMGKGTCPRPAKAKKGAA